MKVLELKRIKNDLLGDELEYITKLEIVYHLDEFGVLEELSSDLQQKLVDFAYLYWIELDSLEHTLWDYLEALIYSSHYIGIDILNNLQYLSYHKFVELIEEKALL